MSDHASLNARSSRSSSPSSTSSQCSRDSLLARNEENNSRIDERPPMRDWIRMDSPSEDRKTEATVHSESVAAPGPSSSSRPKTNSHRGHGNTLSAADDSLGERAHQSEGYGSHAYTMEYRVYKRRWFGLFQLVLLNIIVSWDWLTFSASSDTTATYFQTSESNVNWLSTGFLFAFVVISPVTLWTLHLGPKPSIIASSVLVLLGNWIRYAGARSNTFGVVVFGQIIIGFAQPFVLAAPTRYSDLWFTDRGRVSATAVASLANPFGGALGQLIGPLWAENPQDIPNLVLYVSIISTVAALPSFFIPAKPPSPPSASSAVEKPHVMESLRGLTSNRSFWIVFTVFSVYVGFFNAVSSLLNQILGPYGLSEDEAGIAGAILIVVGLVTAAVTSPIIDRTKKYLLVIRICVPLIGLSYLAFIFAPPTRGLPAPYVVLAILGASSFSLMPIALEYLVEVTWPASPEVTSVVSWTGGQILGGIFIVIMDALKDEDGSDGPRNNMQRSLVFQAVIAMLAIFPPMLLGIERFGTAGNTTGRLIVDQRRGPQAEEFEG